MNKVGHSHHNRNHNHDKHSGHSVAMFRDKFWLSLTLTIPVLAYSGIIQQWLNFTPPSFPGSKYVTLVLSTVIFFYGGLVFIKGAASEIKFKKPGMMVLISLAIITAYTYSLASQLMGLGEPFFWELATLITIMLLGHWLEMASVMKAESALEAIKKLLPDQAEKLDKKGNPHKVPVSELKVNDSILVRPGGSIPVDGVIVDGASSVNEAAITGESQPVSRTINDKVIAGSINQDGSLIIKVSEIGDNTALAGIMRLVAEAQTSKSNVQILADKAAFVLTIIAVLSGIATFILWLIARDAGFAIERAVTVLIIACPHALGLAIPLVASISTAKSARNGLLVRRRLALETARNLDIVLFDKTGTLTKGEHGVTNIYAAKGYSEKDVLSLAASLEQNSEHIVGRGIVKAASDQHIKVLGIKNFSAIPGLGVQGNLQGKGSFTAASHRYITQNNLKVPESISSKIKHVTKNGRTEVYLIDSNKNVIGALALADIIREESKSIVRQLQNLGVESAMITGDSRQVAAYVAKQLKLNRYFAELRPEDKAGKVKELQKSGLRVAMVGDGINDAPALTQADIGIAIGAGTDIAVKSADIILVKNDPMDVLKIIQLSKATYRKMIQNLAWATGYNIVAIPLAAGILYSRGVFLAPAVGAVFMSLSTVVVAVNAQLLRRYNLGDLTK